MKFALLFLCFSSIILLSFVISSPLQSQTRSFTIDYDANTFLKDGQPFRYVAATLHYFQIPRQLWRDRMLRVRALGCNAIQTYVIWSKHEPEENRYDFSGDANLTEYLNLAQELGFVVVLRLGPYINAEMDFGGFPYWLLKNKDIILRSSQDERYLNAVENWLTYLMVNYVQALLYNNGGPVITAQVENEYGFWPACDKQYMTWLRDLARKYLGPDTVLFTTDNIQNDQSLPCGNVDGALATIDFGGDVGKAGADDKFTKLRSYMPKGPLVNSEFYPGWIDEWGNPHHRTTPTSDILDTMNGMWAWNVTSFTIYPAHGGSNWAYLSGAEVDPVFRAVTESYDFDAPISESGDTTSKFVSMRQLIEQLLQKKIQDPIPESPQKYAYGRVRMDRLGSILDLIHELTPTEKIVNSTYPLTMEDIDQAYGYALYETTISKTSGQLQVTGVRDRAYVMIDGQLSSIIQRVDGDSEQVIVQLSVDQKSTSKLQILVENQGRVTFGPYLADNKGLVHNVTLDGQILINWTTYPIDLGRIYTLASSRIDQLIKSTKQRSTKNTSQKYVPSIYLGEFFADPKPGDTFFDPTQWGKGQLYVNGENIGRYWPQAGPQITVYVPGIFLSQDSPSYNQIYVLELDQPGWCESDDKSACYVEFANLPKFT